MDGWSERAVSNELEPWGRDGGEGRQEEVELEQEISWRLREEDEEEEKQRYRPSGQHNSTVL